MNHHTTFAHVPAGNWLPFLLWAAAVLAAYLLPSLHPADENEVQS